jgi:Secretion system C-terminal sorting domain
MTIFKSTLIIVSFLICDKISGQTNFAPLGSFWNYTYFGHNGGYTSSWTIKVTKDTVINGVATKTLTTFYNTFYSLPPNPPTGKGIQPFGTMQVKNDSVFFEYAFQGNNRYIFGFNMAIGDTITIIPAFPHLYALVDTVYSVIINNDTLKKWKLTKYCGTQYYDTATIIENIGQIDDFLSWQADGCVLGGGTYTFGCFHSPNLNYNQPCIPVMVGLNQILKQNIALSISPIPTNNSLSINLKTPIKKVDVKILDLNMEIVFQNYYNTLENETIDLKNLPSGLYIFLLKSNALTTERKIVKIE